MQYHEPLIVLLTSTLAAFIIIILITRNTDFTFAARIGMTAMLLFTAIGHFAYTKGMEMMMPDIIPFKKALVYITG